MKREWGIRVVMMVFLLAYGPLVWANSPYVKRPEVQAFIQELVSQHQFDRTVLEGLFAQVRFDQSIVDRMERPYEAQPWYQYQEIFLTEDRIRKGVAFWQRHAHWLAEAEQRYQVPAAIIVAILGVETNYGYFQGQHSVLQSLATLAFDYPKRAAFFRRELTEFLLLTRSYDIDPLVIKGSYAGAMGMPQFIPSSYRRYAVNSSANRYSDLFHNAADAITSVANYLHQHGWQVDQPVVIRAQVTGDKYQQLPLKNKPSLTVAQLAAHGVSPLDQSLSPEQLVRLVIVEGKKEKEFWLGFNNFYVITRYNTSSQYALAVYLLSEAIKQQYEQESMGKS